MHISSTGLVPEVTNSFTLGTIKDQLRSLCYSYVQQRIQEAEEAIRLTQASANEETKSSAGDKYETGRAMAQLEIEKSTVQLVESGKLLKTLQQIHNTQCESVQQGNLVYTNHGNFYLSISAGKLEIGNNSYFAVSPASPIGQKLIGHVRKDSFIFNGREYLIIDIE